MYKKPQSFQNRGKLELLSTMAAYNKFLYPADSDALAFSDTTVNLLFRPKGSLVEQNLCNGESYLSEIISENLFARLILLPIEVSKMIF